MRRIRSPCRARAASGHAATLPALLRDRADRSSISLRTELDPELAMTIADRVQLQQVLMNLMFNCTETMKEGSGALTITSKRSRWSIDGFDQ
jgi:C4-dicarboxylate-specific signal transduction histidine kinase